MRHAYRNHQLQVPPLGLGALAGSEGVSQWPYQQGEYKQFLHDLELYLGDPVMQARSGEDYPYALTSSGAVRSRMMKRFSRAARRSKTPGRRPYGHSPRSVRCRPWGRTEG